MNSGVRYVMVARLPFDGVDTFREYEEIVLPLLIDYGGAIEKQYRSVDGRQEVHVLWFPSHEAFEEYRNDYRRTSHRHLLERSGAETDLFEVSN